ncbi:MAG: N-acetylmuramoyl-L-alanine amidase [uncultured Rubrobacteraceae bacterium]|uniref:N-acetylmuramoyl-L-alanine amidase n=1 Tax=uncultured Rubrobacteraceae bacterium TaxID=349277 RepID=A0A6J4RA46_9ACTN|nr:MAG: N-acetylmuramoyl-L-alanine amidase [uncultured Rubrobacteraceae bacterium]
MATKPPVKWYPASSRNYTVAKRPTSNPINKIIIHVTQGSWAGALNWFQNPSAGVSAHYTIKSSDGRIGQSLSDVNIGWHAGNWSYNQTSIGIEHEGYVSDSRWFTPAMYRSSAKLTAYLCQRYRIPVDRYHIIGHNQVPGATHTDPGRYWNWTQYMRLVRQYRNA